MSIWETLSYREITESPEHITRFASSDSERVQEILTGSKGTCFDGDVCWLSHDVVDAYLVRVSDTSDMGVVIHAFGDEKWPVHRHNGSLWRLTTRSSQHRAVSTDSPRMRREFEEREWEQDILEVVPDWVRVGGNWSHMDE